jgi:hypothetical protein
VQHCYASIVKVSPSPVRGGIMGCSLFKRKLCRKHPPNIYGT